MPPVRTEVSFWKAFGSWSLLVCAPAAATVALAVTARTCKQMPRARFLVKEKTVEVTTLRGRYRSRPAPEYHPLESLPSELLAGLVFQEDRSFFRHRGYSPREMVAALVWAVRTGSRPRGASTLTQQLARTLFLNRDRTLQRKLLEWRLAAVLERGLGKKRILELYLNHVYFGRNRSGIGPASRFYFGRPPNRLSLEQSAYLVSSLPNPEGCPVGRPCRVGGQVFRYRRLLRQLRNASPEKPFRPKRNPAERN